MKKNLVKLPLMNCDVPAMEKKLAKVISFPVSEKVKQQQLDKAKANKILKSLMQQLEGREVYKVTKGKDL